MTHLAFEDRLETAIPDTVGFKIPINLGRGLHQSHQIIPYYNDGQSAITPTTLHLLYLVPAELCLNLARYIDPCISLESAS